MSRVFYFCANLIVMAKKKLKLIKDQKDAIKKIINFIDDTAPDAPKWMTIDGKAGVGKTTVLIEIIKKYYLNKSVIAGAIAHKAKSVLKQKFEEAIRTKMHNVGFHSVASMLGMKLNEETGEFEYGYSEDIPIESADLIIIDECSMISGDQMGYILSMIQPKAKIIFSGDMGQLPPIGDGRDNEISPTFSTENIVHLHTRLRQGEDSPILPYSDYYWKSVMDNQDYVSAAPVENSVNENGGIYFSRKNEVIENCSPTFKRAVESGNINLIKYICYRNTTRDYMNSYLRSYIFGNDAEEFLPGDFIILMGNYSVDEDRGYQRVENSSEYIVKIAHKKVGYIDDTLIHYWLLDVDGVNFPIPVIAKESKSAFKALINDKFKKAFQIKDKRERKEALTAAFKVRNSYADIDYSYAITSHKSQGSTYTAVIVDKPDIMNNGFTNISTKYRSMYTSITRASKLCTIIL